MYNIVKQSLPFIDKGIYFPKCLKKAFCIHSSKQ